MTKPTSAVIYRGPSEIDGQPIICIAITKSRNAKTANTVQTLIMREDMHPLDAIKSGADQSVCGDCPARPANAGWCYVSVRQTPSVVWKCYHQIAPYKAGYRDATTKIARAEIGANRIVRIGTYGDPAAVPVHVWQDLTAQADGWNGYTHQWRTAHSDYARYVMASIDDPADVMLAESLGFRCFIVHLATDALPRKSAVCPASAEAGHISDCGSCVGCGGTGARKAKAHRTIQVHGLDHKARKYVDWRAAAAQ